MQAIPVNTNIVILKACSKTYEIKFTLSNAPIDITGWTVIFMAKADMTDPDSSAVIAKYFYTHDFLDAPNGKMLIQLSMDDTNITPGNYYFAIKFITNADPADAGIIIQGRMLIQLATIQGQ